MARQFSYYNPDAIDVNTQLTALGEDFSVYVRFEVTIERDYVQIIARCYLVGEPVGATPVVQALARKPLKSKPDPYVMMFSTAQDCWHQLDRGILAIKPPDVSHGWNGRPEVARR